MRRLRTLALAGFVGIAITACDRDADSATQAVTQLAAAEPECPVTTASIDSAAAVARAAEEAFGGFGVEMQYNVMMVRRDELGYLVRFSVIDPPGAVMLGGAGIVRVCNDGSAKVKSVERPVEESQRS